MAIATRKPLYRVLTDYLLQEIVPGRLKKGDRLPSEAEFAEHLDVSRATMREELGALTEEEFIQKIHSIGSFVTQNARGTVEGIEALERLKRFTETIRRSGYKAEDVVRNIARVELDDEIASYASLILTSEAAAETAPQRLRVKRGTPFLCLSGIAYDSEHRPLYHALSYFLTDRYKFTLVRRRFLIRRPTRNTVLAGQGGD